MINIMLFIIGCVILVVFIIWFIKCPLDDLIKKHKSKQIHGLFILDDSDSNTTRWILDVKIDPEEIKNMKEIRLKVCKMDEGDV